MARIFTFREAELDGIVDLLAFNNRPEMGKWRTGEEERNGEKKNERRTTRCSEIILGFINILELENNSRVFLRTHV